MRQVWKEPARRQPSPKSSSVTSRVSSEIRSELWWMKSL